MSAERDADGLFRIVLLVLAVLVLFPLLMMVSAMPMMGMMGWRWGSGTGGLSPLWGVGMVLLWLGVLVGIGHVLYRGLVGRVGPAGPSDPALEELRIAYARGDIDRDEFEERRARLSERESR